MADIYLYKMKVDNGGAPCVTGNLLSLGICKPQIRARAKQGSLIFGFGANGKLMSKRLIYIAEITEPPIRDGVYYRNFRHRPDCIYEWQKNGKLKWRKGSRFHKNGVRAKSDIGSPPDYPKAVVLLSRNFRYFGRKGTTAYTRKFRAVKTASEKLGRAYRVHHLPNLRNELLQLKSDNWRKYKPMKIGRPTSDDAKASCHTGSSVVRVC